MFRNYLTIAIRAILKRKLYSFINVFGLSVTIAFCTLIYLYIQDEKSFDQFNVNKDNLYLVHAYEFSKSAFEKGETEPYTKDQRIRPLMSEKIKEELPEVNRETRFMQIKGTSKLHDEVIEQSVVLVDSDFFSMFSFPVISGSTDNIFKSRFEVVLSQSAARKYFGEEDPIGKSLTLKTIDVSPLGTLDLIVIAVVEDPPAHSSIQFEMLTSVANEPFYLLTGKMDFPVSTFVELKEGTDANLFSAKLNNLNQVYAGDNLKAARERMNVPQSYAVEELGLTNITDIHYDKALNWDKVSDRRYAWILGGLATLITLISCINYITLALTASASRRIEVGIRKVVGARRIQIIRQFGLESILLALFASLFGLILASVFLPIFNNFTGKEIEIDTGLAWGVVAVVILFAIGLGVLAGSYPSFVLSTFKPIAVLKKSYRSKVRAGFSRPLVGFQFFLSAVMIICSIIMYRQMKYLTTKNLGYNKDQILDITVITGAGGTGEAYRTIGRFREQARNKPGIVNVAGITSMATPMAQEPRVRSFLYKDEKFSWPVLNFDEETIPLLGIHLIEGSNFSPYISGDSTGFVIVNEAFVKKMGWTDPLHEILVNPNPGYPLSYKVIGVVEDFHYASLEKTIGPLVITTASNQFMLTNMLVKIGASNIAGNMEQVRELWKELVPDRAFAYSFLDEDVARQYESYRRWTNITGAATIFGIIIACLGLFGLSGLNAVNRTKEIGIRKVLGARIGNIFILLNSQYVMLSLVVFTLAIPVSVYAMNRWWLNSFEYRITIGWGTFVISLLAGFLTVLLTVSYHAINAAMINPAETLKNE